MILSFLSDEQANIGYEDGLNRDIFYEIAKIK